MTKVDISKFTKKEKNSTSGNWLNKEIDLGSWSSTKALTDRQKSKIYGQLGLLLKSNVDLKTCLDIVVSQQEKKKVTASLVKLTKEVTKGANVCDAFKEEVDITPYEYYSLSIGEQTGKLAHIFSELSGFFKQKIEQRKKFISAFSYPFIVLFTAGLVVFFMLRFLVPMFKNVYARFGGELPYLTEKLVFISELLSKYGLIFIISIVILSLLYFFNRNVDGIRKLRSNIVSRIPILGTLIQTYYLERFSRFMHLLLSSNVSLNNSIELTQKVIGSYQLEKTLSAIHLDILQGKLLSTSMANNDFFDKKSVALIKVGEEVNQLSAMFLELASGYKDEFDYQTDLLNKLMEPILILFLGIIVGAILVALYLPMFKLSTSF